MSSDTVKPLCDCGHSYPAHHAKNCDQCNCAYYELPALDSRDPFDGLLLEISALHKRKKADYSNPEDHFSNFKVAAEFAGVETYQTFEVLLGVKQARLQELMKPNGRTPQNESIEDTLMDRAVYSILALLYWRDHK